MTNYSMEGRTYRYFRDTPLYPFGYGLSYSEFSYSDLSVTHSELHGGMNITISVTVANVGKYEADEVSYD